MAQHVTLKSNIVAHNVIKLSDVITCLRSELNKDLPIQHIALIFAVVQQPGVSMQALMALLDMPQGSVSRNVKLLADSARGYCLMYTEQDLVNRKQAVVFPTKKCIELVEKLCGLMQEEMQENAKLCHCRKVAN